MNDPTNVAGDVAPAILGAMKRRKDGQWDWRDSTRRSLEAAVASWVVRILEADGHRVTDLWSPDYERTRNAERATRPELAMVIDGNAAALDVTMFTTNEAGMAGGRAAGIRKTLEARLTSIEDERTVLGVVTYDQVGLNALTKRQVLKTTDLLAEAYLSAIRTSTGAEHRLSLHVPFPGIRAAGLTLTSTMRGPRSVRIYVRDGRIDTPAEVDGFIRERLATKVKQLQPWGLEIIVIVHGFYESAEDVRAGFARLGYCPWWRVYWAGASPDLVELVASR